MYMTGIQPQCEVPVNKYSNYDNYWQELHCVHGFTVSCCLRSHNQACMTHVKIYKKATKGSRVQRGGQCVILV